MAILKKSKLLSNQSGFTLLETLIAMAIMLVAFASILMVESGSLDASTRAKNMNIVAMLARNALIESEFVFEGKDFSSAKTEETGAFPEPYAEYQWKREVKEIKFPTLNMGANPDDKEKTDDGKPDPNANMAEMLGKLIAKHLSKSIREVVVSVSWKKGGKPQSYSVTWYWVNLNNDFALSE